MRAPLKSYSVVIDHEHHDIGIVESHKEIKVGDMVRAFPPHGEPAVMATVLEIVSVAELPTPQAAG